MAFYTYSAKNGQGQSFEGHVDAASESEAAKKLREQGLFATQISSQGTERQTSHPAPGMKSRESLLARIFPPVNVKQRVQFWAQLHSVLESGFTVSNGLSTIGTPGGALGRIVKEAVARTSEGETLSSVLADYPGSFPPAEAAMIRAGENAGTLPASVEALREIGQTELDTRRDFVIQLFYPILVMIFAAGVVLLLTSISSGPAQAKQLVIKVYVPVVVMFLVMVAVLRLLGVISPGFKRGWDHMKLTMPGLGTIVRKLAVYRVSMILSKAYQSGVDLAQSVEMAAGACGNASMADKLMAAVPAVRNGEELATVLMRTNALPRTALQFLKTGEKTGNIDTMMEHVAKGAKDEALSALKLAAVAFSVLAMIVAGVVVLIIALQAYGGYANKATGG